MLRKKSASIDVKAGIYGGKKKKRTPLTLLAEFLIIFCGAAGSQISFITALGAEVSYPAVIISAALSCALFTVMFSLRGKYAAAVSGAAAAVFIIWTFAARNMIAAGAANIVDIYSSNVMTAYADEPMIFITEPELAKKHITVLACFTVISACLASAYLLVLHDHSGGILYVSFLPTVSPLVFGFEPNTAAFFAAAASWTAVFAIDANSSVISSGGGKKSHPAHCGFYAASLAALCALAVVVPARLFGYERPEALDAAFSTADEYIHGEKTQQKITEIVNSVVRNTSPSGAINHGKLGEFDNITFDGRTVLEVSLQRSDDTVYLRGFVGSVYTGKSWEKLSLPKRRELDGIVGAFGEEGLSPLLLDGYNLKYAGEDMPKQSFSVTNVAAGNEYMYMPYGLVPESVSRYASSDSGFTGGEQRYIGQVYDASGHYGYRNLFRKRWIVPQELSADEAAYRKFVYENYLDLPESFSPEDIFDEKYLKYITSEELKTGKSTLDEMTVFGRKIYFIRKWLRDNCEYSLSAGKLPAGEDFVSNFLENRKGSCTHFASAAVLMCRYAGIPARYAEGYIVKPADFPKNLSAGSPAKIEVADTRGHAWAEVYLDGYGWYPVEFTSGYGNVRTAMTSAVTTEPVPETETEEAPPAAVTTAETTALPATSPQPVPQESIVTTSEVYHAETTVPEEYSHETAELETTFSENGKPTVGFSVFGINGDIPVDIQYDLTPFVLLLLIPALFAAAILLRRKIIAAKRIKAAASGAKAAALDDYRRFCSLLGIMGMPKQGELDWEDYIRLLSEKSEMLSGGTAETVIRSALKASFGGDSITEAEAADLRSAVNGIARKNYEAASVFGKFCMKFIYCVV